MTTAQVVETSVTVTNSSFQNYTHLDDHTRQTTDTPGFKPFTTATSVPTNVKTTVAVTTTSEKKKKLSIFQIKFIL